MSDKNTNDIKYTLRAGFFCLSLIVLSYIFLLLSWAVFMTPLWETVSIALFLFCFLHISPVRAYLTNLPKKLVRAYLIFFFIFCLGHCLFIPRTTFPFVPWTMFSDETRFSDQVKFYKYEATTVSGSRVFLMPEDYFRSLANGRIVTDLDNLVTSIIFYDPHKEGDLFKRRQELVNDYVRKKEGIRHLLSMMRLNVYEENLFTLDQKKEHLNEILMAIARRYNQGHPRDPLEKIDIIKGTIDISQGPQAKASFNEVWRLSLASKGAQ